MNNAGIPYPRLPGRSGKWCAVLVFLIPAYAAWARGGTLPEWQAPLIWLGGLALAGLVLLPILDRDEAGGAWRAVAERLAGLFKDPALYASLLFLGLLVVQSRNARWPALDAETGGGWFLRPPPVPWLPSAVTAAEGRQMLAWFFPALAAALGVRHGLQGRREIRLLYWLLILNATALSAFGIVQFVSGTHAIYGRHPLPLHVHFFASFGYANHAGAFFNLALCLALSLSVYYLARRTGPDIPRARRAGAAAYVALGVAVPLLLVGLALSLSRAAILLAMAALAVFAWVLRSAALRRLTRLGRFHALLAIAAIGLLGGLAVHAYAARHLRSEFAGTTPEAAYRQTVHGRFWQVRAAAEILRDHPAFGVGGWGYRYYAPFYADEDRGIAAARQKIGAANVHNDPMQFLAEFGAVGFGLLVTVAVLLVRPVFSAGVWRRETIFFPLLGAGTTLAHSLIDLPFRSPAVLGMWFAVLASAGAYAVTLRPRVPASPGGSALRLRRFFRRSRSDSARLTPCRSTERPERPG